jgi:hypothetical protein
LRSPRSSYACPTPARNDPQLARQVLTDLLDGEQEITARCYEDSFGVEWMFARARELLIQAETV